MSQVQDKNVKPQFSYKARKEIVVLYVTPVPGVSHKADVTLEPWTMGGAMSSSCSSSQVAPRICDLFCQSAPIYSSLQPNSTTLLYSTTFSTNLLPTTSSLPPPHPPSSPLYHPASQFLASSNEILIVLNWKAGFSNVDTKSWCYEKSQLPCIQFFGAVKHQSCIKAFQNENFRRKIG